MGTEQTDKLKENLRYCLEHSQENQENIKILIKKLKGGIEDESRNNN